MPGYWTIHLPDAAATARLGALIADAAEAGDTILLSGDIGAGKSHLARALIAARRARAGELQEDIPSPSFTLVQTYRAGPVEIWHVDLYRLGDPGEAAELGLDEAMGHVMAVVEWPEKLPPHLVTDAATRIALAPSGEGRIATIRPGGALAGRLAPLLAEMADA